MADNIDKQYNQTTPQRAASSSTGWIVGAIVALAVIAALWYYGTRDVAGPVTNNVTVEPPAVSAPAETQAPATTTAPATETAPATGTAPAAPATETAPAAPATETAPAAPATGTAPATP